MAELSSRTKSRRRSRRNKSRRRSINFPEIDLECHPPVVVDNAGADDHGLSKSDGVVEGVVQIDSPTVLNPDAATIGELEDQLEQNLVIEKRKRPYREPRVTAILEALSESDTDSKYTDWDTDGELTDLPTCGVCEKSNTHHTLYCPYLYHIPNPRETKLGKGWGISCVCCSRQSVDGEDLHPGTDDWIAFAQPDIAYVLK